MYERASRNAQVYNLAPQTPQRCVRQAGQESRPGSTEEYYRKSLAIPFLDHLQNEINYRFTSHSFMAMHCLDLVASCFISKNSSDEEIIGFLRMTWCFHLLLHGLILSSGIHILLAKTYRTHLKLPFNMQTLLLFRMLGKCW